MTPERDQDRLLGGRFRLLEPLQVGGMSRVYLARDEESGDDVAVKILARDLLASTPDERRRIEQRFRREARLLKELADNPHVVGLVGSGEEDEDLWIAMELVEGTPLRALIQQAHGDMDRARYLELARRLVAALRTIHVRNIVHRDLCPDNVMIVAGENGIDIRFIDFGIGKSLEPGEEVVTQTATFLGKPQYLSPEQTRGEEPSADSDVYALGVILYEMLTGRIPIEARSMAEIGRIRRETPSPLTTHPSSRRVPEELRAMIMACLAKDPTDRPTTDALAECLDEAARRCDEGQRISDAFSEWELGAPGIAQTEDQGLLRPDTAFGPFHVRAPLMRTGCVESWSCHDRRSGRDVVVKVYPPPAPRRRERLRAARRSAVLRHPRVAPVADIDVVGDLAYVATEQIAGDSLRAALEGEPLPVPRTLQIARGLIEAVAAAHAFDPPVVHGLIHPGNVVLDEFDEPSLSDFGGSSTAAEIARSNLDERAPWVSPEAILGLEPGPPADVWALGVTLHALIAGRPPWTGPTHRVFWHIANREPQPPPWPPGTQGPAGLPELAARCLSYEPPDRPSAAQVLSLFDEICGSPDTVPSGLRGRGWRALLARLRRR